jgi:hypothetical protein
MTVKQLSVFLENKPGTLAEILLVLKRQNIDIRSLSLADTAEFGILRMIVSDPKAAYGELKKSFFQVSLTDVIAVAVEDEPGGLHTVLTCLQEAGVSLEYAYAFVGKRAGTAYVIMRMDDTARAVAAFTEKDIHMLSEAEMLSL